MKIKYHNPPQAIEYIKERITDDVIVDGFISVTRYSRNMYNERYLNELVDRANNCTLKTRHARRLFGQNECRYVIPGTDWTPAYDLRDSDFETHLEDRTEEE